MPAIRFFHLQGGCRAHDAEDGKIRLEPAASNEQIISFDIPDYPSGFTRLWERGLPFLGVDFYSDLRQTDGRRAPQWRASHPQQEAPWSCADQITHWQNIAHGAFNQKNGALWDVASRIKHQLRTCEWRLRQVSEAYRDQLTAVTRRGEHKQGCRFSDEFTWLGYLAIQGFLVDACVLRDYLAEYRALLLTQGGRCKFPSKITQMAGLKRKYLDNGAVEEIDVSLAAATDRDGWLYLLGKYRDLVVHCAPLDRAGRHLLAVCTSLPLDGAVGLPAIKFPIPADPQQLSEDRATGAYFDDPELNYAR